MKTDWDQDIDWTICTHHDALLTEKELLQVQEMLADLPSGMLTETVFFYFAPQSVILSVASPGVCPDMSLFPQRIGTTNNQQCELISTISKTIFTKLYFGISPRKFQK